MRQLSRRDALALGASGAALTVTGWSTSASAAAKEAAEQIDKFTGGKETAGTLHYRGPCPPAGTAVHHYVFTVIASDLEPGALPAGLTRDELWEKLKGHAKGVAGIVGLFKR